MVMLAGLGDWEAIGIVVGRIQFASLQEEGGQPDWS
jgi:hypothetical protein